MHVIEVIPLTRGSNLEALTYYSGVAYDIGSIITIPLRKKEVSGLVIGRKPASTAKTAVRAATFSLKKLPEQKNVQTLPPVLIETAKQLLKTTPAKLGAILYALLPAEIRDGTHVLESNHPCTASVAPPDISVLQATKDERYRIYRSRIREAFAHSGSVLFVVPTGAEVASAVESLSQGIEKRVVTFTSSHTPKKLAKSYEAFHDLSQAKLIIVTPSHIFLDRHDITTIIIEGARSPYYKQRVRPYLDARDVLKTLTKVTCRKLLMGDLLPRAEEEYLCREDIYLTESEQPKRIPFSNVLTVIKQDDKTNPDRTYELFSSTLKDAIKQTLKERKNVFLYAARRGLSPVVLCIDCGHVFRCPDSGAPYSLFKTYTNGQEQRWFLSSTSGKRIQAKDTCEQCGSWRLQERGIGIQHIHSELQEHFPTAPIILFDHTTAKTPQKANKIISSFYDTKGGILLGTAMVLPYIEKNVAVSAVVSLDATRSMATWRAEEELFSLLLTLREHTSDTVLLQTRTEEDDLLEYAKSGLVHQFYTEELELREALKYPPYSTFVHLTIQGTADATAVLEKEIQNILSDYKLKFYTAPTSSKNKTTRYGLLRIMADAWPDTKLMDILRQLPPSIRIEVNPHKIV